MLLVSAASSMSAGTVAAASAPTSHTTGSSQGTDRRSSLANLCSLVNSHQTVLPSRLCDVVNSESEMSGVEACDEILMSEALSVDGGWQDV